MAGKQPEGHEWVKGASAKRIAHEEMKRAKWRETRQLWELGGHWFLPSKDALRGADHGRNLMEIGVFFAKCTISHNQRAYNNLQKEILERRKSIRPPSPSRRGRSVIQSMA